MSKTVQILSIIAIGCLMTLPAKAAVYHYENDYTQPIYSNVGSIGEKSFTYNSNSNDLSFSINIQNPANLTTTANHAWVTLYPTGNNENFAQMFMDFATGDIFVYESNLDYLYGSPGANHIVTYENALNIAQGQDGYNLSANLNIQDVMDHSQTANWTGLSFDDQIMGSIALQKLNDFQTTDTGSDKEITSWRIEQEIDCDGRACTTRPLYRRMNFSGLAPQDSAQVSEPIGLSLVGFMILGAVAYRRRKML